MHKLERQGKVFMNATKVGYGRSDVFYLLEDLNRISQNPILAYHYSNLLKKNSASTARMVSWENCIDRLVSKLHDEKFDVTIGIGRLGSLIIEDLIAGGVSLGQAKNFYITRLSNSRWEKIAYVNTPGFPSLAEQAEDILRLLKGAKRVAIIDDVSYSGGTRKTLEKLISSRHKVTAIDLITVKTAQKVNPYYDKWISGLLLNYDPYPTLNSARQVDVMNVSEFIYPSKIIGRIERGRIDDSGILWNGSYRIFKKCAYTSNRERNIVYFGDHGINVYYETRKLQKLLFPLFK